jgi:hypothetical protein
MPGGGNRQRLATKAGQADAAGSLATQTGVPPNATPSCAMVKPGKTNLESKIFSESGQFSLHAAQDKKRDEN